jgi:hypothetical protein
LLTPPRSHSNLPSGLPAWERHCQRLYDQWDITLTGFVIDGFGPGLSPDGLDAYARFSPDGIVAQKIPARGVHGGMPYLRMRTDLDGAPAKVARTLQSLASGSGPRFLVCRSILKKPAWYALVSRELETLCGDDVQVVDLYTLLWLVREYETNRSLHAPTGPAVAGPAKATPDRVQGVAPLHLHDGPFEHTQVNGARAWHVPAHKPGYYLYFDVREGLVPANGRVRVQVEFLDRGQGEFLLEYDSRDANAPHSGAYKAHPERVKRGHTGAWRTATFSLADPRFAGSQNGEADLRFYTGGEELFVRAISVDVQ